MIPQGIFITGTDTGVGKTFIATGIASALKRQGINVGVMKPAHTGCKVKNGLLIPSDSITLARAAAVNDPINLITPYIFKEPVAPYAATKENNKRINPSRIIKSFEKLCERHDYMVVEGIGGVLVPITRDFYVADLIKRFNIPALIVTRPGLGTINHTMLTINCLMEREIPIKGIVINYSKKEKTFLAIKCAPDIIESLSQIPVIGLISYRYKKNLLFSNIFEKIVPHLI